MIKDSQLEESDTSQGQTAQQKQKKIKKPKDKVCSSTNLSAPLSEKPNGSKKQQKAGTYKEKIKDIVSEDDDLNQEEEDMIEGLENIDDDDERKKKKSQLSAQLTRKRRKLYIQLLEKKVKQLGDELDQAKLKISSIEQNQKQRQNSEIMTQLLQERQKLFDKLEEKIKEKDDLEIQYIMDSLRLRLGLSGKTRNQALYSFYDEIVKLIMPFHMKYLIWIATENLDIFQTDKETDSTDSGVWFQNNGMTEQQIQEIRQKILESKKDYDDILHQLDFLKQKMQQKNEFAQNFIDDLRNFFPPINIAKFLVDLDKKRNLYERNNLYPDSYWQQLQQKNCTLNPLKNAQTQGFERPFQNNPNILSTNTQIKEESAPEFKMKQTQDNLRNNIQSLDSSQCSFSIDQLGQSGFLNQQQQQFLIKQKTDLKSEDGRAKSFQEQQRMFLDNQINKNSIHQADQNISNQFLLPNQQQFDSIQNVQHHASYQTSLQNIQSNQSFEYDKYQYSNNSKDNQQYISQYSNDSLQQHNQFERHQNINQHPQSQSKYANLQYQNSSNQQNQAEQTFQNQQNQQLNRNQYQQQQFTAANNNNNVAFDFIPNTGSFQFQDPNQNFEFLLQRDLS
ncbi:hypothetical protein ABPG74_002269 [Tetrahymena malaccensis]